MEPANVRRVAYIVAGVTVLSAATVFLALCARDNSRLLSVSSEELQTHVQAAAQPREIVSADTQPAADSITRVTVPETTGKQAASVAAQPVASQASAPQPEPAVARSHAELLSLENRGTRRYVEFALARSKRFQQVGPLSVGVWRLDSKHKLCDISVLADGHRLDRKHVPLNSPVLVSSSRFARPLQLVVSSIARGGISGYVSEPQAAK
jgi:hypothetical protein